MRIVPIVLLVSCAQAAELPPPEGPPPVPVRLAPVESTVLQPIVHGAGRVRAADEVVLSFPFSGVLTDVAVRAGDRVRTGQTLAALDAEPARARLAQARSALAKAERDASRAEALESTVARQLREDAATALQIATSTVEAAEFEVRRSVLTAPADGIVVERFADPDQTVASGSPVVKLAAAGGFELEGSLPAADALRVEPGAEAVVTLAAFPGRTFAASVAERSGGAGALGTFRVTLALDPTDVPLQSGLVGAFDLRPVGTEHRVVPLSAVAEADGSNGVVYTVEGGEARRVPVEIAFVDGDRVALRGADALVTVVAVGTPFVRDGAPVVEVP